MEFPLREWALFPLENFETAAARYPGKLGAEIFAIVRDNGRVMDHWRIAIGGNEILEASVDLASIIPALANQPKHRMSFQAWPNDITIRRNMVTSDWMDVKDLLQANDVSVSDDLGIVVANQGVLQQLSNLPAKAISSASLRWAVCISPERMMELQLQCLPASAKTLSGKPVFRRY